MLYARARIRISPHRFFLYSRSLSLSLSLFRSLFCHHLLPGAAPFSRMVFDVFYTTGIHVLRSDAAVAIASRLRIATSRFLRAAESSFSYSLLFGIESRLGQTVCWIFLRTESRSSLIALV